MPYNARTRVIGIPNTVSGVSNFGFACDLIIFYTFRFKK